MDTILIAAKPPHWDKFCSSNGWVDGFKKRKRITYPCQTNKKDIPIQEREPLLKIFHAWLLKDVQFRLPQVPEIWTFSGGLCGTWIKSPWPLSWIQNGVWIRLVSRSGTLLQVLDWIRDRPPFSCVFERKEPTRRPYSGVKICRPGLKIDPVVPELRAFSRRCASTSSIIKRWAQNLLLSQLNVMHCFLSPNFFGCQNPHSWLRNLYEFNNTNKKYSQSRKTQRPTLSGWSGYPQAFELEVWPSCYCSSVASLPFEDQMWYVSPSSLTWLPVACKWLGCGLNSTQRFDPNSPENETLLCLERLWIFDFRQGVTQRCSTKIGASQ